MGTREMRGAREATKEATRREATRREAMSEMTRARGQQEEQE